MDDATVYLVPIGSGRFELYTEPSDDSSPDVPDGFWRRAIHQLRERWKRATHAAHAERGAADASGRLVRARDGLIRRIAESIAEQRPLWSLGGVRSASFVHPADLSGPSASAVRERLLAHARQHHLRWLLFNLAGVIVTAALVLLPGPNVIGYYFLFRLVGHYLSWRGARQGLDRIVWRARVEPALTALGALAGLPRNERAEQVASLSAGLHLPKLAAFFDRVAIPAR